jgi:hypothetical protein
MKPTLLLLFFATSPLHRAGQREVLTGYMTTVVDEEYDFLFAYRPHQEATMALLNQLDDPGVIKTFPRVRVEVDRDLFVSVGGSEDRIPVWPRGTDRATALRLLPSELLAPAGVPLSPERWAGANTGLHPTLHENQPFEVSGPADYDGDGVTDEVDRFPADPAESGDNDNDGAGDNADPDDDNDAMSDLYELANHLDPFTADGDSDPDNDGFTNMQESASGTAAQDGSSWFHIETAERPTPEKISLTWQALPGRRYEVWHRPHLEPRGERLAEGLRVSNPERLSITLESAASSDFYFIQVIADPL